MKKSILYTLYALLTSCVLLAQNPNQWIDHSKTYYKIKVGSDAVHRISAATLAANGLPNNAQNLKMFYKGQEIPIWSSTNGNFSDTDYIEFFGQTNDGEYDSQLFSQPNWQLSVYKSLFTDTSAYYLVAAPEYTNNTRYTPVDNNLNGTLPTVETHFPYTRRQILNNVYYPGESFRNLGGIPNFYSTFDNGEGFTGTTILEGDSKNYNVATKSLYQAAGGNAHVLTRVCGNSDSGTSIPDHHLRIDIAGTIYKDTTYEGYTNYNFQFNVPITQLNPTGNTVFTFTSVGDIAPVDKNQVAYIYLTYPHSYDFENTTNFTFEISNSTQKYLEITNFNGGTAPVLYDLTNQQRYLPEVSTNASGQTIYRVLLQAGNNPSTLRRLYISSTDNAVVKSVNTLHERHFTDYSQASNQGNYLIISHSSLHLGDIDQVERFANYRRSAQGGAYKVVVADINDLYDQFAWGIEKHPLSIQKFVNYALDNWATKPELMLLLGKAIQYDRTRFNPTNYALCTVPTYGWHPSDATLAARSIDNYRQQIGVGRVPARTTDEVRIYLDKVIETETPTACTKEDRLWRKNALHIAGGNNISESNSFLSFLNRYKHIYEDTLISGNVVYTYSLATPGLDSLSIPTIAPLINNGLNIINFIGHSSQPYWNVALNPPAEYDNEGKYPFMFSSSCFVGNVHNEGNAMPNDFLFAERRGAIGFLATVSFGFPAFMDAYVDQLYQQFCQINYGESIGKCLTKGIEYNVNINPTSEGVKLTSMEFTFIGDPALKVAPWQKPEYIIEANNNGYSDVTFIPQQITVNLDSFAVRVIVTNIGKATGDSINIKITRKLPSGQSIIAHTDRRPAPLNTDTLFYYIQMGDRQAAAGDNEIEVFIDSDNEATEDCEDNNIAKVNTFIFNDLLVPVAPCNYTIINNPLPTLKASTGQPLLASLPYIIQLDTTALFNSTLFRQNVQNSESGVVQWTLTTPLLPNTVYYWRTSQIPNPGDSFNWQNSSFIYKPDSPTGWNQSHYYQFKNDQYYQMQLDSTSRKFHFDNNINLIQARNAYSNPSAIQSTYNVASTTSINSCLFGSTCNGGLVFVVYKPGPTLSPMPTTKQNTLTGCDGRGTYGNVQCSPGVIYALEFHTGTTEQLDAMVNVMNNIIENGYYVLVYSVANHRLGTTDPNEPIFNYLPQIHAFFEQMGMSPINNLSSNTAFIGFGRKNVAEYPAQIVTAVGNEIINLEAQVALPNPYGTITSPFIGPSHKWKTLQWQHNIFNTPEADNIDIQIYGKDTNGNQNLLMTINQPVDTDISSIDATQYPYIQLRAIVTDSTYQSAEQLQHWRILHDMAGELALNKAYHFLFRSDTLQEGQNLTLEIGLTNVSSVNMDSVLIKYTFIDANNVAHVLPIPRQAPVPAGQSIITAMNYSTEGLSGNCYLVMEVNPNNDQLEKFRFNNVLIIPFFVTNDKINPTIDVTFDGRHIANGEIVSAKPQIQITTKDENPYLALNDTATYQIYLTKLSDNTTIPIYFNNPNLQFTPATQQNAANQSNIAKVIFTPTLTQSGTYRLYIRSRDRSSNNFASNNKAYQIDFEIDTKPAISNMLNYPNPFTTSTQFVFTLTGSSIPQNLRIQIFTPSGKVVREITQNELGPLYIGKNITQYRWDGTDEFGSPLANGLYLYRIIAKLDQKELDHYDNQSIDSMFKNGIGKMYLVR